MDMDAFPIHSLTVVDDKAVAVDAPRRSFDGQPPVSLSVQLRAVSD
jgi:hypothetical protein